MHCCERERVRFTMKRSYRQQQQQRQSQCQSQIGSKSVGAKYQELAAHTDRNSNNEQWHPKKFSSNSSNNSSLNISNRYLRCDFELSKFCVSFHSQKQCTCYRELVLFLSLFTLSVSDACSPKFGGITEKGTHEMVEKL